MLLELLLRLVLLVWGPLVRVGVYSIVVIGSANVIAGAPSHGHWRWWWRRRATRLLEAVGPVVGSIVLVVILSKAPATIAVAMVRRLASASAATGCAATGPRAEGVVVAREVWVVHLLLAVAPQHFAFFPVRCVRGTRLGRSRVLVSISTVVFA